MKKLETLLESPHQAQSLSAVVALDSQLLIFLVDFDDGSDVQHHFHLASPLRRSKLSPNHPFLASVLLLFWIRQHFPANLKLKLASDGAATTFFCLMCDSVIDINIIFDTSSFFLIVHPNIIIIYSNMIYIDLSKYPLYRVLTPQTSP